MMVNVFHCYEFLFLKRLDEDSNLWHEIKERILEENFYDILKTHNLSSSSELWFIHVTVAKKKERFPSFIKKLVLHNPLYEPCITDCILSRYLYDHDFVEMHLDSIFKLGDSSVLPKELFRCPNLKVLSLRHNFLEQLPPDIGRLQKLEYLALTNNKLENSSLPYSLSFCVSLKVLSLDNNLLDALPGFLLVMRNLNTIHRHGNHNYFKATFMWYHTNVNERILAVPGSSPNIPKLQTLKELSAKAIIGAKINFFAGSKVPPMLIDYLCSIYFDFNLCYKCSQANLKSKEGFKVYTFKNPYLGNTCVPFQHWACRLQCAEDIEVPAREEQILTAIEQDRRYNQHIQEAQGSSLYHKSDSLISCCIL